MSTKIYTGFKWKLDNIFEITEKVTNFRERIEPLADEKKNEWISKLSTGLYDGFMVGFKNEFDCQFWFRAEELIRKDQEKAFGMIPIKSLYNFSFDITVLPDFDEKEFLGTYYHGSSTITKEFAEMWKNEPYVEEFQYWNNTDRPSELSKMEWDERREQWERVFSRGDFAATKSGWIFSCFTPTDNRIGLGCEYQRPDFDERVKGIAQDVAFQNAVDDGNVKAEIFEWREWVKSDEGKDMINETKSKVRDVLNPEIEKSDLLKKPQQVADCRNVLIDSQGEKEK